LIRAIELLVSQGHKESEVIEKYSIRKIYYYQEAIEKIKKHDMKSLAIAVRNGTLLSDSDFNSWLKG
jgi:hypothetical protein